MARIYTQRRPLPAVKCWVRFRVSSWSIYSYVNDYEKNHLFTICCYYKTYLRDRHDNCSSGRIIKQYLPKSMFRNTDDIVNTYCNGIDRRMIFIRYVAFKVTFKYFYFIISNRVLEIKQQNVCIEMRFIMQKLRTIFSQYSRQLFEYTFPSHINS